MKINEISWENGNRYRDMHREDWIVVDNEELINESGKNIKELFSLRWIAQMDFEKIEEEQGNRKMTEILDFIKSQLGTVSFSGDVEADNQSLENVKKYENLIMLLIGELNIKTQEMKLDFLQYLRSYQIGLLNGLK